MNPEFKKLYHDTDVRAAICAPYTQLETLVKAFAGTGIGVGAQNVYFEKEGAFTGEISVDMLKEIGVDYCIVGHSERRQYFNETDQSVNRKLKALLETEICPILCVGEVLEEREAGRETEIVSGQVRWMVFLQRRQKESSLPMNRSGPSEPEKRLLRSRQGKCAPASVRLWRHFMMTWSLIRLLFSMAAA